MPLSIEPFTPNLKSDVQAFNARLRAAGASHQFPEQHRSHWLPWQPDSRLFIEYFVARDDTGVHGAYALKHQDFWRNDEVLGVGNCQLPLSEGTIDPKHRTVGVALIADALRRQPRQYALGLGSPSAPLAQLLAALRWRSQSIPFFFKVRRASRVLRNLSAAQHPPRRKALAQVAASTGLGAVGFGLAHHLRKKRKPRTQPPVTATLFDAFGVWVDTLWEQSRGAYDFSAVRDRQNLDVLYPASNPRFVKLRMVAQDITVGWSVCLATQFTQDRHFGNLRVGTLVDCLALPGYEHVTVQLTEQHLREHDVDLVISNQSHPAWINALTHNGFLRGPSNYLLYLSPALAQEVCGDATIHMTRADGDGPIHL